MGRRPCCSNEGLNRGAWTASEDKILKSYIMAHGYGNWRSLPEKAGLKRCGKSCRLRWLNYLRPDIKRGNISGDEEELIIRLHNLLGNRWSLIAGRLPGRTDNEIKNYWNTTLGKKAKAKAQQSKSNLYDRNDLTKSKPKSEPRDKSNKVIRTKATKATRFRAKVAFVPNPLVPSHENSPPPAIVEPILVSDILESQAQNYQPIIGDETILNGQFGQTVNHDHRNSLSVEDVIGPTLPFDDESMMFNDWVPSTGFCCLGDEENATMDLEYLTYLLDSDDWP